MSAPVNWIIERGTATLADDAAKNLRRHLPEPIQHLSTFAQLWVHATWDECLQMAGVCSRMSLLEAATAAFTRHGIPAGEHWEKLIALIKRRAQLRYERGELLQLELAASGRWLS